MTLEEKSKLFQEIEDISKNFEDKPWTENLKLFRKDFDINLISTPKHYLKTIDELQEILRETRLLFIYSVLNKVCIEEGKLYNFDTPYQASIKYNGVMKKEGSFNIIDEDGEYREIFTNEAFTQFIDDLYWELYE